MLLKDITPKETGPYPCFTAKTACGQIERCKAYQNLPEKKQGFLWDRRIVSDLERTLWYRQWVSERTEL